MSKKDKESKTRRPLRDHPDDVRDVVTRDHAPPAGPKTEPAVGDVDGDDSVAALEAMESEESSRPRSGVLIVGIGASAGGLKAFRSFLEAVPPETGMAFVLVPHLDPKHESMMVDLLSQRTTMPLREAKQ